MASKTRRIAKLEKKVKQLQEHLTIIYDFLEELARRNPSINMPSLTSARGAKRRRCVPEMSSTGTGETAQSSRVAQLPRRENVRILTSSPVNDIQFQDMGMSSNSRAGRLRSTGTENVQKRGLEPSKNGRHRFVTPPPKMPRMNQESTIFESSEPISNIEVVTSGPQDSNNDTTGEIFRDSFERSLNEMIRTGDVTLEGILSVLNREAFVHLKAWRPKIPEITSGKNKSTLIKKILSPQNIHRFINHEVTYSSSQKASIWPRVVEDAFPSGTPAIKKRLVKYLSDSSRNTGFFGHFISCVVRVHREHCQQCCNINRPTCCRGATSPCLEHAM